LRKEDASEAGSEGGGVLQRLSLSKASSPMPTGYRAPAAAQFDKRLFVIPFSPRGRRRRVEHTKDNALRDEIAPSFPSPCAGGEKVARSAG
jgi:hypothetical protein